MKQNLLLILILAMLNGCASTARVPAPVETREPPTMQPPVVGPPLPPTTGEALPPAESTIPQAPPPPPRATASSTLLASVDSAIAAGELDQAAALAERAIRISPRDGNLWYRLASIRFQQRRYADAAGFARRALSFASVDPALRRASTDLLEQATAAQQSDVQ